jgi:hypothetical protein
LFIKTADKRKFPMWHKKSMQQRKAVYSADFQTTLRKGEWGIMEGNSYGYDPTVFGNFECMDIKYYF